MSVIIPEIKWYTLISEEKGIAFRCPFASVHRCPRFYQSLSLLGNAGSTSIDPAKDKKLLKKWKKSELWPVTDEYATSVAGSTPKFFSNFCPEVSFDRFGLFASYLGRYSDEIDIDTAHSNLEKELAHSNDWRWRWASISPMHYSECPLFSLLNEKDMKESNTSIKPNNDNEDIVELKPNFFGFGINLKALIKRLLKCITFY